MAGSLMAQDYPSGHGALEIWDTAARDNAPIWIGVWLRVMQLSFVVGLLFVWRHGEARWAVGGFFGLFVAVVLSQTLTEIVPLSGFIALLHVIFWSPALYVLLTRRPFMSGLSIYSMWSGWITLVILFSFVFDIPAAAYYLDHILALGLFY
ncbi:MAG: hypothetical protein AAF197_06020 [Pseudomonadota bacterium]